MHVWQVQQAKAQLSQLVQEAQLEPQIISRNGVETAVVLSMKRYQELMTPKMDIVTFFRSSPLYAMEDLDLERDTSPDRDVKL